MQHLTPGWQPDPTLSREYYPTGFFANYLTNTKLISSVIDGDSYIMFIYIANTRYYRFTPSQADVSVFKAITTAPDSTKYPHAARWYKHIASYESEFETLSGDPSKPYTAYGPDIAENQTAATANSDDEEEEDLFGSDDEEEDPEAIRAQEERLAAYREKKAAKPKPAAKSIVTLEVKPWGKSKKIPLHWLYC